MKISKFIGLLCFAIFFSSQKGQAQNTLHLDGLNDRVHLGNVYNFNLDQKFSVEAWVKVGPSTGISQIISRFDANYRGWGFQINPDNNPQTPPNEEGVINFYLSHDWNLGSLLFIDGTTNIRDNQWHHVAVTYDGSGTAPGVQLYVDGVAEGFPAPNFFIQGAVTTNNAATLIGALDLNGAPIEHFAGNIDELRVWNIDRTAEDIVLFRDTEIDCLPQNNLLGYYKFNQGISNGNNLGVTNLIDASDNNNNGTLTNFALTGNTSNWSNQQPIGDQSNLFCECYGPHSYCTASGFDVDDVYTNSVSTIKFDNINSSANDGYDDFRGTAIEMVAGSNEVIKVTRVTSGFDAGTGIWVDWNQNGIFEQSEQIMDLYGSAAVAGILFTVPNSALSGHTRMRVITEKNNHPNACGDFNDGEVEDYCVVVRKLSVGETPGTIESPHSSMPFPNPASIGYQVTTTTTSPIVSILLVNSRTGQTFPLSVTTTQTSATGGIESTLLLPTSLFIGLYNLVLLTQDGTLYSDNLNVR